MGEKAAFGPHGEGPGPIIVPVGTRRTPSAARARHLLVPALVCAVIAVGGWGLQRPAPDPILITKPGWAAPDQSLASQAAVEELAWLEAGVVPGEGTRWEQMSRTALLDLRRLSERNGAVRAGAADRWAYAWPRDSAFAAVALSRAGHQEDALRVLHFLARLDLDEDEGFEARYLLSGVGAPDDRARQSDGAGWTLWALAEVSVLAGGTGLDAELSGLLERCTEFVRRQTQDGSILPPPSPDYWEVPVARTSLGTAAPLLAGLNASERLHTALGDPVSAVRAGAAAQRFGATVESRFAPFYERFGRTGGLDASVAMMMPPFVPEVPAVVRAWEDYQFFARRPAGGLAPGADWKRDGVSWTPETGLVALAAAASGRRDRAEHWLDWLNAHRTGWGSLPEKVTASGKPAGPAPLAWTAALVLLTVAELDRAPLH
jgi:GH15 family glucan-1,4-alpha-glucosidase